jgi:hypothetical protein
MLGAERSHRQALFVKAIHWQGEELKDTMHQYAPMLGDD